MSEELQGNTQAPNIISPSSSGAQSLTVEVIPRHFRMHSISENELDSIAAGDGSINLTFFGVCFGALISFGTVLYNGGIDPSKHAMYVMLTFASAVLAAFFGVRGSIDWSRSETKLKELKQGHTIK